MLHTICVLQASFTGPHAERSLKIKSLRQAAVKHRIRRDRDCMLYEDDLSYLAGKYAESQQRKVDYDRYFILANK